MCSRAPLQTPLVTRTLKHTPRQLDDPWREAIAKCILRAMVVLEEQMEDGEDKELLVKGGRDLLRVFGAMLGYLEEHK